MSSNYDTIIDLGYGGKIDAVHKDYMKEIITSKIIRMKLEKSEL